MDKENFSNPQTVETALQGGQLVANEIGIELSTPEKSQLSDMVSNTTQNSSNERILAQGTFQSIQGVVYSFLKDKDEDKKTVTPKGEQDAKRELQRQRVQKQMAPSSQINNMLSNGAVGGKTDESTEDQEGESAEGEGAPRNREAPSKAGTGEGGQGPNTEVADTDQQQLEAGRVLRRQQLSSQDQARATKAIYTGPPPKKIGIGAFIIMFCLGLMKDLIDFVDWGILGIVLNIVPIMGILLIVAVTGGSLMDFMNKKKYILGSGAVLEFIPIIGFLPIWTLSILWLWLEARKGRPVSGKAATRLGKKVAGGKRIQGAVKRLGLKKG